MNASVKSRRSYVEFCTFYKGKVNGYISLNILIANFMAFLLLLGRQLSCISSLDSSPKFFSIRCLSTKLGFPQKKTMPSDICNINFHVRSNAGIMAGNRDTVNQSES